MWDHLVDRKRAGDLAGVTDRTITRWVNSGILTKYLDGRGRVRFDSRACEKLRDPEDAG